MRIYTTRRESIMKVWRYYLKPDGDDREIEHIIETHAVSMQDLYPLFAITNIKKYAKSFESIWDMSKFIRKTSHMTKEEYSHYANRHRSKVIEMYEMMGDARRMRTRGQTLT